MRVSRIALLIAAVAVVVAVLDNTHASDKETIAAEVQAADELFNRAVATRDLDLFTSLIDENATFLGAGLVQGREAIVNNWAVFFTVDRRTILNWHPHTVEVAASGDLAYTLGDFEINTKQADGSEQVSTGTYVSIWKKHEDGSWKVVVDAGTPPQRCE